MFFSNTPEKWEGGQAVCTEVVESPSLEIIPQQSLSNKGLTLMIFLGPFQPNWFYS